MRFRLTPPVSRLHCTFDAEQSLPGNWLRSGLQHSRRGCRIPPHPSLSKGLCRSPQYRHIFGLIYWTSPHLLTMAAKEQGESEFEVSIRGEQRTNKGPSRRAVVPYCRGRLYRYTCDCSASAYSRHLFFAETVAESIASKPTVPQRPIPRCAMCSLTSPVLRNSQESLLEGRQKKSPEKKKRGCFVVLKCSPPYIGANPRRKPGMPCW